MTNMNTTNNYEPASGHNPAAAPGRALISGVQTLELLLALSIFVAIRSLRQRGRHGLPSWPVLGMLPSLLPALHRGDVYDWITGVLLARGGTFTFRGPWLSSMTAVLTSDPRNLEHLLKTSFPSFPKGDYFRTNVRDLLGDGIFAADHGAWRRQRRTASLEFHSSSFRALTTDSLVELVHARLLPVLDSAHAGRRELDLQDVLLRLTFDNVCILAFGTDPGCSLPSAAGRGGLPEVPFARAFEDATEATTIRFVTPTTLWRVLRFFDVGYERTLRKALREVDEFAYGVIRARKGELAAGGASRSDLLTAFMRLRDEDGEEFSEKFLRDICVNFILAGRDTSSVALAWFFWLLGSNGEVEEKIVEEVRRMVEERGEGGGGGGGGEVVFKPEEVKRMDYLNAALSEALRLYPSVPVDNKQVAQDEVFPDGTVLKKGTKVIYSMYTMGRMESIWGKDCREYRPERWLKADGRYSSESAYKFTAFNGGPRLCLGKDFAYYQMKFVAASILYRYRVRVVENHPVAPKLALTMYMKHGLKVTLSKRKEY